MGDLLEEIMSEDTLHERDVGRLDFNRSAAPYTKLPNELVAEIFALSTPKPVLTPVPIQENECPWTLLRVCRKWRGIALGMTELWDNIHVAYEIPRFVHLNAMEKSLVAQQVLLKSKNAPLTLEISSAETPIDEIWLPMLDMMTPHFLRLKSLTLDLSGELLQKFLHLEPLQLDTLEYLKLTSDDFHWGFAGTPVFMNAHQLRHFHTDVNIAWRTNSLPWSQLTNITITSGLSPSVSHDFLRLCTNVVSLYLKLDKPIEASGGSLSAAPILLVFLTTLTLQSQHISQFLLPLVHPRLTQLELLYPPSPNSQRVWDATITPVLRTFQKLETLTICALIPPNDVHSLLVNLPSLIRLKILGRTNLLLSTLSLLSDGVLAPKLQVLQCKVNHGSLGAHLLMLETRANGLKGNTIKGIFHWDWDNGDTAEKQYLVAQRYRERLENSKRVVNWSSVSFIEAEW